MNVLVNLISIKKGGGQQVATNFITHIAVRKDLKIIFLVTEGTVVHEHLKKIGVENKFIVSIKNSLSERVKFSFFKLGNIINTFKIDIIYTMFGPGLHHKGVKSITGCAYSNLFFPEIDFWKDYSFLQRLKFKLIDIYRLKATLKSDAIVFENEAMRQRAISLFKYPANQTKLILPSISELSDKSLNDELENRLKKIDISHYNILLLTGWHKNKNIDIIPDVLKSLHAKGVKDVSFIITVPINHPDSKLLLENAKEKNVDKNILLFDAVTPFEVSHLIYKINAIALFSKLESFSNNIIEAWSYKKALFISNEEWSKAICKDSAIYVERDNPSDIANKITKYKNTPLFEDEFLNRYLEILKFYPDPKQKVDLQIEFLKKKYNEKSN